VPSPTSRDSDVLAALQRFAMDRQKNLPPTTTEKPEKWKIPEFIPRSSLDSTTAQQQQQQQRRGFEQVRARSFDSRVTSTPPTGTNASSSSTGTTSGGFFPPAYPLHFPHSQQQQQNPYNNLQGFPNFPRKSLDPRSSGNEVIQGLNTNLNTGNNSSLPINLPPTAPLTNLSGLAGLRSASLKDFRAEQIETEKWRQVALIASLHRQQQQHQQHQHQHHQQQQQQQPRPQTQTQPQPQMQQPQTQTQPQLQPQAQQQPPPQPQPQQQQQQQQQQPQVQ